MAGETVRRPAKRDVSLVAKKKCPRIKSRKRKERRKEGKR